MRQHDRKGPGRPRAAQVRRAGRGGPARRRQVDGGGDRLPGGGVTAQEHEADKSRPQVPHA